MVLPASESEPGDLTANNPYVCQSSYQTGSVTTSQASITGEAVKIVLYFCSRMCAVSVQSHGVTSLTSRSMYDEGVKLCIPLEGSCTACRSRCCTWPSLACPALAQAQCSGHREGQPAMHTHLLNNNHSQDGC